MYLFDTNILSEVMKKKPNIPLMEHLSSISAEVQFTSCICVMELRYGSQRRPDNKILWKRIETEVLDKVVILPITEEIAIIAGDLAAILASRGQVISPEDLLIAATAVKNDLTLITSNERHFVRIPDLKVENWLS
ncbi:MAG: PIN domain-containing protein [Nitrospirota bacterium]